MCAQHYGEFAVCLQKQLLPSLGIGLRGGFFNPLGCSGAEGGSKESGLGPQGPAVTTNTHSSLSRLSPLQSIQSPMAEEWLAGPDHHGNRGQDQGVSLVCLSKLPQEGKEKRVPHPHNPYTAMGLSPALPIFP